MQKKQEMPARSAATVGGKTVVVQPKLTINQPGDRYEQEADRVADAVMGMKDGDAPVLQRMPLSPVSAVQRESSSSEGAGAAPAIVSEVLSSGGGRALDAGTQQFMESRFGRDFSEVRVHDDSRAADSAAAIQARAYTSGQDVVFGQGEYRPGSTEGRRLLAHELGHVGQQGGQKVVQRATFSGDNQDFRRRVTHDRPYEILAHDLAYMPYVNLDALVAADRAGFTIAPGPPYSDSTGLRFWKLRPTERRERQGYIPVIAFTGSEELGTDWVSDVTDPEPGSRQFTSGITAIRNAITELGGRVDVTGHSLGGALAQITAAFFPEKVRNIVTFQAPGIRSRLSSIIRRHNDDIRAGRTQGELIQSTHYRADHDIVDDAGEAHTEGTTFDISFDQTSFMPNLAIGGELGRAGGAHPSSPLELIVQHRDELQNIRVTQGTTSGESLATRPVEQLRQILRRGGNSFGITTFLERAVSLDNAIVEWATTRPNMLTSPSLNRRLRSVMIELLLTGAVDRNEVLLCVQLINTAPATDRNTLIRVYSQPIIRTAESIQFREILLSTSPLGVLLGELTD